MSAAHSAFGVTKLVSGTFSPIMIPMKEYSYYAATLVASKAYNNIIETFSNWWYEETDSALEVSDGHSNSVTSVSEELPL